MLLKGKAHGASYPGPGIDFPRIYRPQQIKTTVTSNEISNQCILHGNMSNSYA